MNKLEWNPIRQLEKNALLTGPIFIAKKIFHKLLTWIDLKTKTKNKFAKKIKNSKKLAELAKNKRWPHLGRESPAYA